MIHSIPCPSHLYSSLPISHLTFLWCILDFVISQNCSPQKWQTNAVHSRLKPHDCSISIQFFSLIVTFSQVFSCQYPQLCCILALLHLPKNLQHHVKSIAHLLCLHPSAWHCWKSSHNWTITNSWSLVPVSSLWLHGASVFQKSGFTPIPYHHNFKKISTFLSLLHHFSPPLPQKRKQKTEPNFIAC